MFIYILSNGMILEEIIQWFVAILGIFLLAYVAAFLAASNPKDAHLSACTIVGAFIFFAEFEFLITNLAFSNCNLKMMLAAAIELIVCTYIGGGISFMCAMYTFMVAKQDEQDEQQDEQNVKEEAKL